MKPPKRTIVHVAYDVTDVLTTDNLEGYDSFEQYVKEFFADTPEVIMDADWIGVVKVEVKQ